MFDVENKFHFVFYCHFYWELHNTLFSEIKTDIGFINMDDAQRLSVVIAGTVYRTEL